MQIYMHSDISNISQVLKITPTNGCGEFILGKMAVNRDQILEPIMEAIRRNFFFIQKSIAASRPVLLTVAGYLLQFELITRQNHDDALASSRLVHQAATLMRTVELKIKSDPYLYFPRFTQVLRLSDLSYVADSLEQQALSLQMPEYKAGLGML